MLQGDATKGNKTVSLTIAILLLIALFHPYSVSAHGGRTDGSGGHYDGNDYHYHHGYPAHDHYDIDGDGKKDCPYDFDDQTNHNSNNSSNNYTEDSSEELESSGNSNTWPSISSSSFFSDKDEKEDKSKVYHIVFFVISLIALCIIIPLSYLAEHKDSSFLNVTITILYFVAMPAFMVIAIVFILLVLPFILIYSAIAKRMNKKSPEKCQSIKYAPSTTEAATRSNAKKQTPPSAKPETILSLQDTLDKNLQQTDRLCRYLWLQTFSFRDKIFCEPDLHRDVLIWTAFFYSATKTIRKQSVVNEIYIHFPAVVSFAIENGYFPHNPDATPEMARQIYEVSAKALNSSGIDPRNDYGLCLLWDWVAKHLSPIYHHKKEDFMATVNKFKNYIITHFDQRNDSSRPDNQTENIKYSLSDTKDIIELP